jgi:DNA-binding MarR family transcriptional regulator
MTPNEGSNGSDSFVLDNQIGHLLRRAHQRASAALMTVLAEHQLTPTQFFAMARLWERGELSQNRLGRLSAMDPATIQGVVRRLGQRGYVERRPDPTDRRRMVLQLTPSGWSLVSGLLGQIDAVSGRMLAPLTPDERDQLRDLLRKIV